MNFLDNIISDRLGGLSFGNSSEVYKFELIKKAKLDAMSNFPDIPLIDLGVGEPDGMAHKTVIDCMYKEASLSENRFYADNGISEFQEAAIEYMKSLYGVDGLSKENLVHGIGSKPILAYLPLCFINPGDILLTTVPGYPICSTHTKYLGGKIYNLPLEKKNGFLPDLESIPLDILKKAKALYINYPNNPTGATATHSFFKKVVNFCKKHKILAINDAAYASLTYGDNLPLSFLSVKGAMDIGVEIHSMSKAFNMTGWRMAFICGNSKIVKAYATIKDNTDSGQFRAIQKAAIIALKNPQITKNVIEKYSRRMDLLVSSLNRIGFNAIKPNATFYCYVEKPKGTKAGRMFETAAEFSDFLIRNALISTVPWDDAGNYIRFSVTFEADSEAEEIKILVEIEQRLSSLGLIF